MRVFTLPEPSALERKLKRLLKCPAGSRADWRTFPNGEHFVTVRGVGRSCVVVGRTEPPADNIVKTFLLIDALGRNGAREITLALPYFGYSRHDRAAAKGDSVATDVLLTSFAALGVSRIVTVDVHNESVKSFFPRKFVNVSVLPAMAKRMKRILRGARFTVVSPDGGGRKRAELFARSIGADAVSWVAKKRLRGGNVTAKKLKGARCGHVAVIVDDMVDTGGTIKEAVKILRQNGFRQFYLCATHPVLSADAKKSLDGLGFECIFFSDTVSGADCADLPHGAKIISGAGILKREINRR